VDDGYEKVRVGEFAVRRRVLVGGDPLPAGKTYPQLLQWIFPDLTLKDATTLFRRHRGKTLDTALVEAMTLDIPGLNPPTRYKRRWVI